MLPKIYDLTLDLYKTLYADIKKMRHGDNNILNITLRSSGEEVSLSGVETASLAITRPDKVVVVLEGSIENNVLSFVLDGSELSVEGYCNAVVQLYDADDRVSSVTFKIEATEDPTAAGYIPTQKEQTLIQVVLGEGPLILAEAAEKVQLLGEVIDENKFNFKGDVPTRSAIPTSKEFGDAWFVIDEGATVRWNGTALELRNTNNPSQIQNLAAQLDDKASKQDVNDRVAQIVSGSPKGTYSSLSALQTAKPTGDTGVYLTTDNGHWYWWNGSVWVDGGVYQAADLPISEKSITRNLFDKDAVIEGKQVLAGGNIVNYANSAITPYIDVEGLTTLYFSGLPTYTSTVGNRYGKFYDASKSPVGADVLIPTSATTGSASVPSGAKYFVLSIYQLKTSSEVVDYGIIQIESGGIQTPYVAYQAGVYEIEGKKIIGSNPVKVPLKTKGKSLLLFGDSITHTANVSDDGASYTEGALTNWPTYSKATLEVGQMWNYAFGGAAYRDRDGVLFKQKISNQITAAINNNRPGDIIVAAAGTNDQGINMGSYATAMSKTTRESLDRTLFYEAVRWAFWTIRLNYPNAICFASTPVQRAAYEPIPALSNAIKEMARRYNFIVIDAEFESGIVRDFEVANGAGRYLTDGLHPNYDGKILLSKLFNREILNAVNNAYESL